MRRLLLNVILLLGFLFGSGFSIGPEMTSATVDRDSTTVEVKFQNPRVIISDQRTSDVISEYLQNRDTLDQRVISFLEKVVGTIEQDQERRYESALDYLSRRTQLPPGKIVELISDNISRRNKLLFILSTMYFSIIIIFLMRDTRSVKYWNDRLVDLLWVVLIGAALYLIYLSILRIFTPSEFEFIQTLTQLSG